MGIQGISEEEYQNIALSIGGTKTGPTVLEQTSAFSTLANGGVHHEAYLIEKGKITKPVKGATLIGSGIEVMQKISMVADKSELDLGIGVCGKEGQSVPVGVGQPALKIDEITVGGTN